MSKVLLSTGSLYHMGLERIFQIASKSGFKYLELMLRSDKEEGGWDCWDIQYLKRLQGHYNLKIISLHSPIDFESRAQNYIDRTIFLGKKLKVNHIVFHVPKKIPEHKQYRKWFKVNYSKYLSQAGITFLTENMGPKCIEHGLLKLQKYPDLCFDIAHELSNGSAEEAIKLVKSLDNIRQFHVSWFDGSFCHMSMLKNKKLIKTILLLRPKLWKTIELQPVAFPRNGTDEKSIIKTLKQTRIFLQAIN